MSSRATQHGVVEPAVALERQEPATRTTATESLSAARVRRCHHRVVPASLAGGPPRVSQLDPRGRRLRAAPGFLTLEPRETELRLLHRWVDSWSGIGLVVAGVTHQGFQVSLGEPGAGQ